MPASAEPRPPLVHPEGLCDCTRTGVDHPLPHSDSSSLVSCWPHSSQRRAGAILALTQHGTSRRADGVAQRAGADGAPAVHLCAWPGPWWPVTQTSTASHVQPFLRPPTAPSPSPGTCGLQAGLHQTLPGPLHDLRQGVPLGLSVLTCTRGQPPLSAPTEGSVASITWISSY